MDFACADCRPCPSWDKCTSSVRGTRTFILRPRDRTAAARAEQGTEAWRSKYAPAPRRIPGVVATQVKWSVLPVGFAARAYQDWFES
ncbi:transposase [Streptomyces sp. NBC_00727]|uniref:transposase n=1 Tax=Streptomyces sp. NBC_00727 TaxID=2903675 RepID=UPI00386FD5A7